MSKNNCMIPVDVDSFSLFFDIDKKVFSGIAVIDVGIFNNKKDIHDNKKLNLFFGVSDFNVDGSIGILRNIDDVKKLELK